MFPRVKFKFACKGLSVNDADRRHRIKKCISANDAYRCHRLTLAN